MFPRKAGTMCNMDVERCKNAWTNAKTDTERFAALFVVIKYLKSTEVTDNERQEIFQTIGFSFLHRLLQSDVPEGCPPSILKAVAVAILSCFCSEPNIAADQRMHSLIPLLHNILLEDVTSPEDEPLIVDTIGCLLGMAKYGKCAQALFDSGIFPTLVSLYSRCSYGHSQAFLVLMHMIVQSDISMTEENYNILNELMKVLAHQFYSDNSQKKFELCEHILYILLMHPSFELCSSAAIDIREALREILQSKIGKEQRDVAIKLAGLMVAKFVTQWFVDDAENSRIFYVVLVQIISVEIKMLLDEKSVHDISGNAFLLTACYKILECAISTMVGDNWFQSNRVYAQQLLSSLKMAMTAIIDFLKNTSTRSPSLQFLSVEKVTSDEINAEQILLATIRVFCAWLAEETLILQDEICDILPFVLSVCEQWFAQSKDKDTELDPLRFLMAPLCHLTADDCTRKILLSNNLLGLLMKYMDHHWNLFEEKPSADEEIVLTTTCGILLNIVVLEPQLVAESEDFFVLLKRLFTSLPALSNSSEHLILKANFAVLGLLIVKHCYKKVRSCETSFYRFLSASIKFLWDAYCVEEENNLSKFVITRQYHAVWGDVSELWFLGMQALSTLLLPMPWIACFLAESGWPVVIIEALSTVSPGGIESSVKYTYQALLCPLVKISGEIASALLQHEALSVAKKHGLQELEGLFNDIVKP